MWFRFLLTQVPRRTCDGPGTRDVELIWVEFPDGTITLALRSEFCNGMRLSF